MAHNELARSIKATFKCRDVPSGWVLVPDLMAVLGRLQSALVIVFEDLAGSRHRPEPSDIPRHATFRFGRVRAEDFSATLALDRPEPPEAGKGDLQQEAVDQLLEGIAARVSGRVSDLPPHAVQHVDALIVRVRLSRDSLILEGGRANARIVISGETHSREAVWPESAAEEYQLRESGGIGEDYPPTRAAEPRRVYEGFWHKESAAQMAASQGVRPLENPASLVAPFCEENDEDEFVAALRRWRKES